MGNNNSKVYDVYCKECNITCCPDCQTSDMKCCSKFNNGELIAANTLAWLAGPLAGIIVNGQTIGTSNCENCKCSRGKHEHHYR